MVPEKNKYADSKSSAYLHGTWLKTKKYQTVILAYVAENKEVPDSNIGVRG